MNKNNLIYLVSLLPFYLNTIHKISTSEHKHEILKPEHPDIIVKQVKNATNYPIKVVLRSGSAVQDLDTFQTIPPHSKEKVNIHLEYIDKSNAYGELGFRWLKPNTKASKEVDDSKPSASYIPTGGPSELKITLVEDQNNPGSLKVIKYIHLHKKKHKKHTKHHHNHNKKHKHQHKNANSADKKPIAVS